MYLESLQLKNYRNYVNEKAVLSNGMNVLVGENGAGKTNLLEAVYLLSTTRSHRNDDDRELIFFDRDFASAEALLKNITGTEQLSVIVHRTGKTLLVNNVPLKRNSEFIGRVNAVMYSPKNLDLFNNSPRYRRRLIDIELGKLYPLYMRSLNTYLKCLKERNAYLKNQTDPVMLETYTEMLYEPQAEIIRERQNLINSINRYLSYYYSKINGEKHEVKMVYHAIIEERADRQKMIDQMKELYDTILERDLYLKQTNTGIHREDYEFFLDDREVSKFCSQGQKRMVLLALKLSIVRIIEEIKKDYPILLLDDVFSELDVKRKQNLINLLPADIQTVITTTDLNELYLPDGQEVRVINIEKGKIRYDKQR